MGTDFSVFEYLYRDAGNYKVWGKILIAGTATTDEMATLLSCLEVDGLFVAEQVGIPVLYQELWKFSGGRTEEDHAYHEFFELRPAIEEETVSLPLWSSLKYLLEVFNTVNQNWNCALSMNSSHRALRKGSTARIP